MCIIIYHVYHGVCGMTMFTQIRTLYKDHNINVVIII